MNQTSRQQVNGVSCILLNQKFRIDIIVPGRFHGFALANALIALGHDVLVHTNYPKFVATRFGLPKECVRSLWSHGLLLRAWTHLWKWKTEKPLEGPFHRWFGRWASRGFRRDCDLIYGFTGVIEETLRISNSILDRRKRLCIIVRGSAHILEQAKLLHDEEIRIGEPIDHPSTWMIQREIKEYKLADKIAVLSRFAFDSFVSNDISPDRIIINPLGVDSKTFKADENSRKERERRILSGEPLTVLFVGSFLARKGAIDFLKVSQELKNTHKFKVIGSDGSADFQFNPEDYPIEFIDRIPEKALPAAYAKADIFLFPTIEDGFAAVLLQAASAGLLIISTPNCSAPDIVSNEFSGFIVPIRDQSAMISRLRWCDQNRKDTVAMIKEINISESAWSWTRMASEIVRAKTESSST